MQQSALEKINADLSFAPKEVIFDGKIHRFGHKSKGWYIADLWQFEGKDYGSVIYSDFSTGERYVWHSWDNKRGPKKKDPLFQKMIEGKRLDREEKAKPERDRAARKAKRIWGQAKVATDHPYLHSKGLKGSCFGAKVYGKSLVVPVINFDGELRSLLFIMPDGTKRFLTGGEKAGCMFLIGAAPEGKVYIAEGFATAATVHVVTGQPVLVAFDAGNLVRVAQNFRARDPECNIIFAADNDQPSGPKKMNVGVAYANTAARAVQGAVVAPSEQGLDFNDLHQKYGEERVKYELGAQGVAKDDFRLDLANGFYRQVTKNSGTYDEPDPNRMADYFKHILHFKHSDESSYIYEDGYYRLCSRAELDYLIETLSLRKAKSFEADVFASKVKSYCYDPHKTRSTPQGLINLKNGILDVKTRQLRPHSPSYFFKHKLAHSYIPEARSELFGKFLWTSFQGDQRLIDLIGEIMGYLIMGGDPVAHRAFVLYGEGRNGKSTLLSTVRSLLGHNAVSSVSLRNLDKPFSMVQLDGKLANIVDESPNKIDAEGFKNVVGGGYVTAAHKGKPEYDLKVNARLLFACNRIPYFGETSTAIKDRLIFVPFDKYIEEKDRDVHLETKLRDPREMSGILNFALDGLDRFLAQGFTTTAEMDQLKDDYEEESDTVLFWALECLEWTGDADKNFIQTADLYQHYLSFCRTNNMTPVGLPAFGRRLRGSLSGFLRRKGLGSIDIGAMYKNKGTADSRGRTGRGWFGFAYAQDQKDILLPFARSRG